MNNELITQVITTLEEATEILYKGDVNKGMATMLSCFSQIEAIAAEITDEALLKRFMSDALTPALSAMEQADATELADIISYELIPILQEL